MIVHTIHLRLKHGIIAACCTAALVLGLCLYNIPASGASGPPPEGAVQVPIIMYHGLLKETKRTGAYVVTPETFEKDLQYLKEKGYTTIVMQDLLDYVGKNQPLPEKPIMLTFDDGYYNNYLYAFPLLKQYGCKMVLSPIGRYTDEYSQVEDTHANYST